jgi:copper resistance protein B
LRYEIEREFAPYVGIEWTKKFGETAKFTKLEGENISQSYWVSGIKAWF